MPTESLLNYKVTATGAEAAARQLEGVEKAIKANSTASTQNAAVTQRATAATASSVGELGKFGSALGMAGGAIGRLNPLAGQMVSTLGQATGTIQALATTGLGPLGIALGVATAAFGLISSAVASFTSQQQESNRVTHEETIPAIDDLIKKLEESSENLQRWVRLGQGQGGVFGQQAFLQQKERERAAIQVEISDLNARYAALDENGRAHLVRLEQSLSEVNASISRRQQLFTQAITQDTAAQQNAANLAAIDRANALVPDAPSRSSGGGGARGPSTADIARQNRGAAELAMMQERVRLAMAESQARERLIEREIQITNEHREQLAAKEAQHKLDVIAAEAADAEQRRLFHSFDKDNAGEGKLDAAKAKMDEVGEVAGTVGDAFASALGSSENFGDALVASIDAYLLGLAKQETVKAIVETAEGFAALANPFTIPLAAGHFQSAALHGIAAGLAGAASAAIPNAPAPASGGTSEGARPERSSGGGSGGGNMTVNVNFGGQVVTAATEAELGRKIGSLVERGQSRFGR